MRQARPLSITGMGLLSAAGLGLEQTRSVLFDGQVAHVSERPWPPVFRLRPERFWMTDETSFQPNMFALAAAREALKPLTPKEYKTLRIGVCVGSTVGCTNYQESFSEAYNRGELPHAAPLFEYFNNNTAQFLAKHLGLNGPVQMISNACTSGGDALGIGAAWLRADLCDAVLCGGTEVILPRIFYGFRSLMLCASEMCRPFDKKRDGLTLGEGAGFLLLEKADTKREVQAQFLGYGAGSDAYHPTSPDPNAGGLNIAVSSALKQAGIERSQVDFINAHATATPHNDLAEGKWIRKNCTHARVSATKGYTGHMLASAGAVEAIMTIMSLQDGRLPASAGFNQVDEEIGLTPTQKIESGDYRVGLSLSLGFGGTNTALCIGRADL